MVPPVDLESTVDAVMATGNGVLLDMVMKCRSVLERHERACVSVSGGGDSDCMLDLVERTRQGTGCEVFYIWFDTGLEYRATRRHLAELEDRYGVEIVRYRAKKSIPACAREYGQPFLSKYVSAHMERLQRHGFQWEDEPYEDLLERYPDCSSALKWWCNRWTRTSEPGWFDIGRNSLLKEFVVANHPWFRVSNKCCTYSKKKVAADANREFGVDLELIGIRKSEGGARAAISKCFSAHEGGVDTYRPLLWLNDSDRLQWDRTFGLRHSDCYEVWGFRRTGCVGCPFGREVLWELDSARAFEPMLVMAAETVFKDSYEYTRMYRDYQREHGTGQMRLDLRHAR